MKNKTNYLLMLIVIFYSVCVQAQNGEKVKYIDVIYLKDGTTVKGVIVYQVPKVRVSIRCTDIRTGAESVYNYPMGDIEKIAKEPVDARNSPREVVSDKQLQAESGVASGQQKKIASPRQGAFNEGPQIPHMSDPIPDRMIQPAMQIVRADVPKPVYNDMPTLIDGSKGISDEPDIDDMYHRLSRKQSMGWNRQIGGFRVLLDYVYTHGIGSIKNNRINWATSLGFQFNPIYYIGAGVSYDLTLNKKQSSIPVFINSRINFLDNNITPYLDLKVGYSIYEAKGLYFGPTVGMSFALSGTKALSIGLGYSFQKANYKLWVEEERKKVRFKDTYHGLQFKITCEFNISFK